ncbi:uncharacterized protein K460DRAFT_368942 [Cucurbitaria berberidis CBS 394.84]|uniref:Prokaryotic-type class I peptide chain release factors domain-containing protein n=1 Tax=Cucurbitaria berberidis CBS 394.84 TaxID=1168544 RepID=A0A9P4L791_9PLEO|nr:uncharacterized protein K460DRAFT_368942 [Cucurbitaria berberidis CBS 394.84]KAF1844069.1 hypothetical protein K460DRAFT_368942 [Cucurbitaria berberidis CBS 394.84]
MHALRFRSILAHPTSVTRLPPAAAVHRQFTLLTARHISNNSSSNNNNSSSSSANDDELQAARTWLAKLHAEAIPLKSIGELSFSRSSGPGGQNVNKVNSKATLRVPLDALLHHVPTALHGHIKRCRYAAAKSNTLLVQADDSRKQSDNAHSCYKRLYEAIVEAGHNAVPAQTSAEQVQRVKDLQKSDNERRLKTKKQQSAKKTSRRGRGDD